MALNNKMSLQAIHPKRLDIVFLILVSAGLLMAGFKLPILTVRKLWENNSFSILTGITNLWGDKYYFLAALIFFFSIIFPVAKLAALSVIWFFRMTDEQRKRIMYFLELLGRWSMLDVFVVALLVVSIKLGVLASAKAEIGIYFFGASVLLAMIVTALQGGLIKRS